VSTALLDSYAYNVVYRISLFISCQYVVPTVALVCLNWRVIVALRRSDTYRLSAAASDGGGGRVSTSDGGRVSTQSTRSITLVVCVIVSICIVVHVVALASHVVATLQVHVYRYMYSFTLRPADSLHHLPSLYQLHAFITLINIKNCSFPVLTATGQKPQNH